MIEVECARFFLFKQRKQFVVTAFKHFREKRDICKGICLGTGC